MSPLTDEPTRRHAQTKRLTGDDGGDGERLQWLAFAPCVRADARAEGREAEQRQRQERQSEGRGGSGEERGKEEGEGQMGSKGREEAIKAAACAEPWS